jgi:hypothetical protein
MIHLNSDLNVCVQGNFPYLSPNYPVGMISSMPKKITLRDLFPNVSDRELEEIGETLHGHCAVVWRIYERLEREHPEIIDDLMKSSSMKGKVDSSKNTN